MQLSKIPKELKYLFVILLAGLVIRLLWLPHNLFFGFEQGRDMLVVKEIVSGNPTLIGPWTSIKGFFHGALSYWILVPAFILSSGDPLVITIFLIITNLVGLSLLFVAVKENSDTKTSLLAISFIAFSYVSIIYARWLSNPNLVPAAISVLLFSLIKSKSNPKFLPLVAVAWVIIFHFQAIAAISLLPAVIISIPLLKIKINPKNLILSALSGLVLFSSYIVFDVRNQFIMSKSLSTFVTSGGGGGSSTTADIIQQFLEELQKIYFNSSLDLSIIIFIFVILINIHAIKKDKQLLFPWLFLLSVPIFFLSIQTRPLNHYLMPMHIFVYIVTAVAFIKLSSFNKIFPLLLALLIIGSNINTTLLRLPENVGNFLYHAQRTYFGDMKVLVDYAYTDAQGEDFYYDYYSVPYWKKEAWYYMFSWYGKSKFGYIPDEDKTDRFYVFIEPDESQPAYQQNWYNKLSLDSVLIDTYTSGKLKVEVRNVK